MRTKCLMIACAVCAVLSGPAAYSADLMQVYEQATRNDPFIQEARSAGSRRWKPSRRPAAHCSRRSAPPARWRPASATAALPSCRRWRAHRDGGDRTRDRQLDQRINADSLADGRRACARRVPLGPVAAPRPGGRPRRPGQANRAAQQDLMVRVSQRYFDVLAAAETLRPRRRRRSTPSPSSWREAERRFEVGVVTVIDVEEARSARDIGTANVIAAKRALAVSGRGCWPNSPANCIPSSRARRPTCRCRIPSSAAEQAWVDDALDQNLGRGRGPPRRRDRRA